MGDWYGRVLFLTGLPRELQQNSALLRLAADAGSQAEAVSAWGRTGNGQLLFSTQVRALPLAACCAR